MKLLVVEDHKKIAQFVARALREEGFDVEVVEDGEAALRQLAVVSYDVVILDRMLPDMDGAAVCQALRARGDGTPVLMVTARGEVRDRVAGLDAGADDYLVKPFEVDELVARTRALARRAHAAGAVLEVGPLRIDHAAGVAYRDGERMDLTPRELGVFSLLMREAGRVVPRTRLLAQVWGMNFDPESNVVEVHMKHLRDKLGPHGRLIETVRGIGYKLKV